ncbi:related to SIN3 - transcription regulatory protein [Melanopsichium pennsylvanicum]|uniref:Related to SIN3 - transcription regulatory protein n=2 Tax=Melanopsichium pennsylvanicum TaxID=63383 RepID=A0AAJ5C5E0_9BASI|nr:related to SIN3-transcription regulatory protein [Melanopsichium pennsylvanicum 4]SNX84434.1 related to SIN3 - transcription regulatory protein [Melanopsichium pennsylvanicum]
MATLNVKDALSYLDQVKVQFAEHPDVYNRFLDIMKDFKSQSIDTPGVIERVSTLFRGHPSLIQGFNTFLPPGYRIECSLDPSESNLITVTTPTGTTTQTPGGVGIAGAINRMSGAGSGPPPGPSNQPTGPRGPGSMGMMHGSGPRHADQPPSHMHPPPHAHDGPPAAMPYMGGPPGHPMNHGPSTANFPTGAGQPLGPGGPQHPPHGPGPSPMGPAPPHHSHGRPQSPMPMGPGGAPPGASGPGTHTALHAGPANPMTPVQDPKRPPVEFNHAINYVNKIKQRFSQDPDTYKQFLEILQTYQKEQRPIHDVYAQVTVLFENATDLLDEFKQFLPDTTAGAQPSGGLFNMLGQVTSGLGGNAPPPALSSQPSFRGAPGDAPEAGRKTAVPSAPGAPPSSRKKRSGANESGKPGSGKTKKSKHGHKAEQRTPPLRQEPLAVSPTFAHPGQMHHVYGIDGMVAAEATGLVPQGTVVNGLALGQPQAPLATLDEVAFFDRVKKHIDDRTTYLDFLKLLNLYTQDIIDVKTLVDRAALFIGGNRELFVTFKGLCGYDMGRHGWLDNEDPIVENVPAPLRERVDLNNCKVYGASYRKLPKSEVNLACSGRDPMCWEVLNDSWVSHPTWASEGEGFNPHKKNPYEDALYRSEEERHEYDYHIEANLRTIALLEPIAARISTMDNEEKAAFRLKPGLGGQSKSIYQRVIKKVYGREQGLEVINALHDTPCVSVPIVLHRLKQKDEEWKRAQREWNKVWREVDARNYYKSLDHQGVNFKASDKKAITAKAFLAEIEARKLQQQQRRLSMDPTLPRPKPRHQLVYVMDNMHVLTDVLKLAFSYLDRATGSYSSNDRERIEAFLRAFVPKLLAVDATEFEELLNGDVELDDDEAKSVDEDARSEDTTADDDDASSIASGSGRRGKKQAGDLRKKILKNQAETSKQDDTDESVDATGAAASANARASSPSIVADVDSAAEALANQTSNTVAPAVATTEDIDMEDAPKAAQSIAEAPADDHTSEQADSAKAVQAGESSTTANENAAAEESLNQNASTWINTDLNVTFDSSKGHSINVRDAVEDDEASASGPPVNFFCNSQYFVFIRLLQLLYSRLHKVKALGVQMANKQPLRSKINPLAIELGLQDGGSGPAAVVGAAANSSSLGPVAPTNEEAGLTLHPSRYYDTLLDMCEKLFDGDVDQGTYEESVRYMYGIEGYIVFTLDKVIGAMLKVVQFLATDSKCQEMQAIMEANRANPQSTLTSYRQQIANRMAAEGLIGKDESLFRLEWVPSSCTLLIQMLSKDDLTMDDASTVEQNWLHYMSSFSLWTPTEGLPAEAQAPFIRRSLSANGTIDNDAVGTRYVTRSGLEIRICLRTFKLFFAHGTEDVFVRIRPEDEKTKLDRKAAAVNKRRSTRWDDWLSARRRAIDNPSGAVEVVAESAQTEGSAPNGAVEAAPASESVAEA